MGKVFDALKKAEQEASISQAVEPEEPEQEASEESPVPVEVQEDPAAESSAPVHAQQEPEQEPAENSEVLEAEKEKKKNKNKKSAPKQQRPRHQTVPRSFERSDWDERLTMAATVTGTVAESFRTLRTRILHPESGEPPRNILVTSAAPGEGKSFVCANLGISFAQGVDNSSLLVNCDLRKPSLERLFGLANDRGLVNYLRDKEDLGSLIADVGVDKLRIIPAGPPPVNPAELLGSGAMQDLIEELGSRYEDRIVLFDSPPLLAAAETAILAKHVDAVVIVVRSGSSRREHVQSMVDKIGKEKVIGVVFNAYTSTMLDSKVFGSYQSQYGHYYGESK